MSKKLLIPINSAILSAINSTPFIMLSLDKIELITRKYIENIKRYKKSWVTTLGIFITLTITLLTTDFKDFILPAVVWTAIAVLGDVISFIITVVFLYNRIKYRNILKIETLIKDLKESATKTIFTQEDNYEEEKKLRNLETLSKETHYQILVK